jgi:hydrogenase nickel incorporation protein HypB
MHRHRITVVEGVLDANDRIAAANRADFDAAGVTVVNLMSSPGSGKTMLLERLAGMLDGVRLGVIEGDVQGSCDSDRIAHLHLPVVQINTASGFGGECHLDANMVRSALSAMPLEELDVLIVENVGNLVCPAEFRIGEHARAMVISITEGEDKPLKYPLMFHAVDVVVINKMDLLEHLDFDLDLLAANIAAINAHAEQFRVSARSGDGVEALRDWLVELPARDLAHDQHV